MRRKPVGFVAIDMLVGIAIVGTVSVLLMGAMRREQTAERSLADSRAAIHLAEHALLNLQHGQALPKSAGQIVIHHAAGGAAPAGFAWERVEAVVNGRRESLIGVVPISTEMK